MADPQDRPDGEPDATPGQPAKKPPADKAAKTPAKKTPAKKTPAKKAPAQKAPAKKAPAKKAPAKKAPATKPPAQSPEPAEPAPQPTALANVSQQQPSANGQLAEAAKDAAAQAKSTVDRANNPLPRVADEQPSHSTVPLVVAIALSLLAMLLIRQLRRR
ncbi:nucleoid-structuring protein H-NS [Mycobacterium ulcerans]|uniref:Histone-like protein Hns n=1 Tax=Mycobacterium ulcerans (strain Agy99) TaxID=362242 RepID=A0PX30_MYCUA|nr:hypothetical protein [Mycobacterium ulcerans]ABL06899.1 histone-like protein Hns [Mycobacterium ulcerans Agy99]MEB3904348.1 nucleoid-structuring protein H-NS [Mycobacterium ulcerans]MEB3908489.1 nucleoid-structuring protein H-NS [Mycobacterium ulcerans]MEB3918787.1 nucleoid-structuring protein H-NS [Mycobacterium ulcerans]MEB3922884.1 nucleoid-structuring protein H-NS [Mycobacterium ulcerans]